MSKGETECKTHRDSSRAISKTLGSSQSVHYKDRLKSRQGHCDATVPIPYETSALVCYDLNHPVIVSETRGQIENDHGWPGLVALRAPRDVTLKRPAEADHEQNKNS